jgi:hypothetical protein
LSSFITGVFSRTIQLHEFELLTQTRVALETSTTLWDDEVCSSRDAAFNCIRDVAILIYLGTRTNLIENFRDFPESFREIKKKKYKLGYDRFLPDPFQLIVVLTLTEL